MSSQTPVFPIGTLSFTTDRAITNAYDVAFHISQFQALVKQHNVGTVDNAPGVVYSFEEHPSNGPVSKPKFSIGPLEISIAYDSSTGSIVVQAFLNIPIIGTVQVGSVSGSLKDGVSINIGWGSILGGLVGVKLRGSDVVLYWEFKAFGKEWKCELPIHL